MNAATPVDMVAEFLKAAGFVSLQTPLDIAGLSFDFPAAFVGSPPSPDLILVADTAFDTEQRILKKIEGVARALDVVRSKRPLTLVVAGPRPHSGILEAMTRVCRVLPVGPVLDDDPSIVLKNWLAVLTPLHLPDQTATIADPLHEMAMHLEDLQPVIGGLVELAPQGAAAVQTRLHEIVAEPLDDDTHGDTL
jgi:hypothetical protein